jgi:hypothetical protein
MIARRHGPALLAALLAAAPAVAQTARPGDPADLARKKLAVAAQQVEADTRAALTDATRLASRDPGGAVARLRDALAILEADNALDPLRRDSLMKVVRERIRTVEAAVRDSQPPPAVGRLQPGLPPESVPTPRPATGSSPIPTPRTRPATTSPTAALDAARIRAGLKKVEELWRAGDTAGANRQAAALAREFPDNPAAQAMTRDVSMAIRLADARDVLSEMENRVVAALRDVDRSALPPIGDIEFPKDWAEKTARRKGAMSPLTAKEKAVIKALNTDLPVDFRGQTFTDVLQYLSDATEQPILVDRLALKDAEISTDQQVNLRLPGRVPMKVVLKQVLRDLGLGYIVKDGSIQVTTQERVRNTLTTQVYPIGDLVTGIGPLTNAGIWGPYADFVQTQDNVAIIAEMVRNQISPDSWKERGGPGSIGYDPVTKSLIVRQTAEVHLMLRGSLAPR